MLIVEHLYLIKEKKAKKAYKDALKSIMATRKDLEAALRKAGVDPEQFKV